MQPASGDLVEVGIEDANSAGPCPRISRQGASVGRISLVAKGDGFIASALSNLAKRRTKLNKLSRRNHQPQIVSRFFHRQTFRKRPEA